MSEVHIGLGVNHFTARYHVLLLITFPLSGAGGAQAIVQGVVMANFAGFFPFVVRWLISKDQQDKIIS